MMNLCIRKKNEDRVIIAGIVKVEHAAADGDSFIEYNPLTQPPIIFRYLPTNIVLSLDDGSTRIVETGDVVYMQYLSDLELADGYKFLGAK